MDAACHYCERPASFAVLLRSRATEDALVQRQRLCDAHDAIVASLASVLVLERRPWHLLPEIEPRGTVLDAVSAGATITRPVAGDQPRRRGLLRSLVGR